MARLPCSLCVIAAATLALIPALAGAQDVAPLGSEAASPPAVVGWLAQPSGSVWVAPGVGQAWQPPLANQPLTSGEIVATAPDGQVTIEVMGMRALLGPGSELALRQLGVEGLSATETSGEVALDLSDLPQGANVDIATPRGTVEIATPGRYEITAGGASQPTVVTALQGGASVTDGSFVQEVGADQTATLTSEPNGPIAVAVSTAEPGPLLRTLIASAPPVPQTSLPPVVAEMTGGVDLASYGTWSSDSAYGTVWFPNVAPGWVPYREGRWVYLAPWGWTWVDSDPWGFAPFHYGRWVQIGPRWGWVPIAPGVPVIYGVPVYAPALVQFFAIGSVGGLGGSVRISSGALERGMVGWVPLGPGQIYRPPYAVSPAYLRRVNVYNVRNIDRINVTHVERTDVAINRFVNRGAVTIVPATVLADGGRITRAYRRPTPQAIAALRPLPAGLPVRPAPHPVRAELPHGPAGRPFAPAPAAFHAAPTRLPRPPSPQGRPGSIRHPTAPPNSFAPSHAAFHPPTTHPAPPTRPAEPHAAFHPPEAHSVTPTRPAPPQAVFHAPVAHTVAPPRRPAPPHVAYRPPTRPTPRAAPPPRIAYHPPPRPAPRPAPPPRASYHPPPRPAPRPATHSAPPPVRPQPNQERR